MKRFKYPRTPHLPFSPGATSDDAFINDCSQFEGKQVIISEKRDGECSSLYPDGYVHARSIDGTGKEYQEWLVTNWRNTCFTNPLPEGYRIVGENLYAKHSIEYTDLKSYFNVFAMFNYIDADIYERESGRRPADDWTHHSVMSWQDINHWCRLIDIEQKWLLPVPVLYEGMWDEKIVKDIIQNLDLSTQEGIVVRNSDDFLFKDFSSNVAKWVRKGHVQTDQHWSKSWTKNKLEE